MSSYREEDHPRVPAGQGDSSGQWTTAEGAARSNAGVPKVPEATPITNESAKKLIDEWEAIYGEGDAPFWQDPGDDSKYVVLRDDKGKPIAGATTHTERAATFIDSIHSHSPGAGVVILDWLKSKNIFITAMASTDKSKAWFVRNGFRFEPNRPYQYNVIWVNRGVNR